MAAINWDALSTVDDWSDALQALLAEAKSAIRNNDSDKRLDLQAQLSDFIVKSPGLCAPLDAVARAAARDLFTAEVDAALAALAARDAELAAAVLSIRGATEKADESARSIQFRKVIDALDRSKAALDELKELQQKLAAPDQSLLDKIKTVNDAIDELRAAVKV